MDISDLTDDQRQTLRKLRGGNDKDTVEFSVYEELKALGIVCVTSEGEDRLSELGELLSKKLNDGTER